MSELRYHPFLDQWVITATHRQDRTFFPPADYNPLAPTKPGGFPTEVPFENYDLVVFENKFPSLRQQAETPAIRGTSLLPVRPSEGVCEVVCYTADATKTFAELTFLQVRKLTRVWRDRYIHLSALPEVEYVFIFENKGKEIGVTLSHPHGQIYAYPFIPPVPREELANERRFFEQNGKPLMEEILGQLLEEQFEADPAGQGDPMEFLNPAASAMGDLIPEMPAIPSTGGESTLVWENDGFIAFVPSFARYPYEVYVSARRHIRSLAQMDERELDLLAEALLVVTRKYDKLFGFSMPYIMAMHQQPAVEGYDFSWFHVEFYPPYRTESKLKYLAGSEAGAGAFINDTLPEVTAAQLRALVVDAR